MQRTILALVVLVGAAACGDDDGGPATPDGPVAAGGDASAGADGPAADTDAAATPRPDGGGGGLGSAIIDGTIVERIIVPQVAFFGTHPVVGKPVLVMSEDTSAFCFGTAGDGLDAVIGFPCGAAAVGSLPIDADPGTACAPGAPHVFVLVEGFTGEFSEYLAESGTVEITSIDDALVVGSFSANFGDKGGLIGSFSAVVCPAT